MSDPSVIEDTEVTFDTAENYGLSEISLGNWMRKRKNRDKVVIISKGCHPYDGVDRVNPEEMINSTNDPGNRRIKTHCGDCFPCLFIS